MMRTSLRFAFFFCFFFFLFFVEKLHVLESMYWPDILFLVLGSLEFEMDVVRVLFWYAVASVRVFVNPTFVDRAFLDPLNVDVAFLYLNKVDASDSRITLKWVLEGLASRLLCFIVFLGNFILHIFCVFFEK